MYADIEMCMPVWYTKALEQTEVHILEDKLSKQTAVCTDDCKRHVEFWFLPLKQQWQALYKLQFDFSCLINSYRPVLQPPNYITLSSAFAANRPGRKTLSWS